MCTKTCPCDSQIPYNQCCEPIHHRHASATHPEQLMRSRYSAYVLGLVNFIVQSYHSSTRPYQQYDDIKQSTGEQWIKLEIQSSSVTENGEQGFVEFKAYYIDDGTAHCLHEISRFVREEKECEMCWFYVDGEYPDHNAA